MRTRRRQPMTVLDLVPEPMRSALRPQGQLGLRAARVYLEASDESRARMLARFHRALEAGR